MPPYAGLDLVDGAGLVGATSVDVLANDHDANGDAVRLVSVEPRAAAGGSASIQNGKVAYLAPVGGGKDSFRYVIQDACGQTATGVVFVRTLGSGGPVPSTPADPTGPTGARPACAPAGGPDSGTPPDDGGGGVLDDPPAR